VRLFQYDFNGNFDWNFTISRATIFSNITHWIRWLPQHTMLWLFQIKFWPQFQFLPCDVDPYNNLDHLPPIHVIRCKLQTMGSTTILNTYHCFQDHCISKLCIAFRCLPQTSYNVEVLNPMLMASILHLQQWHIQSYNSFRWLPKMCIDGMGLLTWIRQWYWIHLTIPK
jgi:hypothetical protein